jgi:uncharacterized protein (DUF58 family)
MEKLSSVGVSGRRLAPSRTLVHLAWGLTLGGALAAALPGGGALWLLVAAGVAAVALVDAWLGMERLRSWRLEGASLVRTSLNKPVRLRWVLERPERDAGGELEYGLEAPEAVRPESEEERILLASGGGRHVIELSVRPRVRGLHESGRLQVSVRSALGLWEVRGAFAGGTRLRVHPDILGDRRSFAVAFLPRFAGGTRLRRQLGRGREFEKLREYLPGDGSDEIHWKATARRGHPVTKVFQVERTQEVYVLVDASRLSGRRLPGADGREVPVLERQVSAALALAGLARRQGDRLGLVVFADQVLRMVRAGGSTAHFNACREHLSDVETRRVAPDYRELFSSVAASLRRRALLVFLTDLSDEVSAEAFARHLPLLTRRHLVLVVQPKPRELEPVFRGPEPADESGLAGALAWHWEWESVRRTLASVEVGGARTALLDGPGYVGGILNHYMNLRREQAL